MDLHLDYQCTFNYKRYPWYNPFNPPIKSYANVHRFGEMTQYILSEQHLSSISYTPNKHKIFIHN